MLKLSKNEPKLAFNLITLSRQRPSPHLIPAWKNPLRAHTKIQHLKRHHISMWLTAHAAQRGNRQIPSAGATKHLISTGILRPKLADRVRQSPLRIKAIHRMAMRRRRRSR